MVKNRWIYLISGLCFVGTLSGCGNNDSLKTQTNNMSSCESCSINVSLDFEGTISNEDKDTTFAVHNTASGICTGQDDKYTEDWIYKLRENYLGTSSSTSYELIGTGESADYTAVIKDRNDSETGWTQYDELTTFASDHYFVQFLEAIEELDGKNETYEGTVRGDLAKTLIISGLDPTANYDTDDLNIDSLPIEVATTDDYITSMTMDCKLIGQQFAEMIADKSGIRITVDSFTATVTYDDFNRVQEIDLPNALNNTEIYS